MGGDATERTRTEDGVEGARQGAEGEGGKEGADLLRGGHGGLEGHGWEYLCEWEGEQRDSWVRHDKMESVEYARPLASTWGGEFRLAQCVRRKAASYLGAVLATSQIAPREPLSDQSAPEVNTHGVNRPKADVDLERP